MSGRASNQVNNLRALFEQSASSASPPTRDRSPAGPDIVKGNESRLVSKVRTSFIAVQRSGSMAPILGLKKVNDEESKESGQLEGDEPQSLVNGLDESSKTNGGKEDPSLSSKDRAETADEQKDPQLAATSSLEQPQKASTDVDTNKDRPLAETGAGEVPNADEAEPVDNLPISTAEQAEGPQGLGDILKGAPFENEIPENAEASGAGVTGSVESGSSSFKGNAGSKTSLPNGQPKKQSGSKTSSPPKPQSGSSRPLAIDTGGKNPSETAKTSATSPSAAKRSPRTPGSPDVTNRQPMSKTASPRQSNPAKASNGVGKEVRKAPIPKQTQSTAGAKASFAPASKQRPGNPSSASNPVKKAGSSSPTLKVRPKSPPRPVRLPAAATAATASSAAKTGEASAPRPSSRTGAAAGSKSMVSSRTQPGGAAREGATTAGSSIRKSSSRPSLSAAPNPPQKSKPRTSMASVKAPEGSFLARMMRPTQSSASKVHEKIEHAAAQAKVTSHRPKRKSGASDERGQEPGEAASPTATQQDAQEVTLPINTKEQNVERADGIEAEAATSGAVET